MKKFLTLILISAIIIIIFPVALLKDKINPAQNTFTPQTSTTQQPTENTNTLTVFRSVNEENIEIDFFEYVCGSVAAEMPLSYHEEALKAQAIACYTNALRLKNLSENNSDYHITDDSSIHQGYLSKEQRKEKWGEDFSKYENKLETVVKAIENLDE